MARRCATQGIRVLLDREADFPERLAAIPDPPFALFVTGEVAALARPAVAVVGSRRATPAAREVAFALSAGLAANGFCVVSGLARGIDAAAHAGALSAEGCTVAVLGGGHARLYPPEHRALAQRITSRAGAIVSEYPPDQSSRPEQFPERNRIVSGLSLGVVVVEASARSGSLITARLALEQGREVMAVPGPIGTGTSRGCHGLIKQGAALIESVEDVLACLGLEVSEGNGARPVADSMSKSDGSRLDAFDAQVLEAVQTAATPIDDIVHAAEADVARVLESLARLELAGFVAATTGGYIRRPSL